MNQPRCPPIIAPDFFKRRGTKRPIRSGRYRPTEFASQGVGQLVGEDWDGEGVEVLEGVGIGGGAFEYWMAQ